MAYRLVFFIILTFFLSTYSYSQTLEKINIKSAGWKDISESLVLDLDLPDGLKEISKVDKYSTILALYKAYKDGFSVSLIKNILNNEGIATRKKILYLILSDIKEKKDFENFLNNFGSYLNSSDFEDLRFFYYLRSGKLDEYKGKNNIFNDLKNAILSYIDGNIQKSLEVIEPYKNDFPRIYTLILFKAGRFTSAIEFLDKLDIDERDYFRAIAYYYLKRYDKALEILSKERLDYKSKLLYIDLLTAIGNYNIPDFQKSLEFSGNLSDEINIFRNFKILETFDNKSFKDKADILKIKWQMKNYAYHLSLYVEEIKNFQERLKKIEKELSSINERFSILNQSGKEDLQIKEISQKIVAINEIYETIKKFKKTINTDTTFLTFFEGEYEREKKEIEKIFQIISNNYKKELEKINAEIYARKIEKTILDTRNLDKQDIQNILIALKKLEQETENDDFSFKERVLYYQIYLLNELIFMSSRENIDEREKLIGEAISIANKYLDKFKQRKAEVILFLAEIYESIGDYDRALKAFYDYLAEKKDGDFRIYMKIAEILFEKKDYQKAITFYEKAGAISKLYKDSAYYKIGWSYYLSGQYDKVINLFLNYKFEVIGQRQELLLNEMIDLLSRAFYKIDNLDIVEAYLDKNRQFPYPDKVFKYLGDIYLYLADYEKAISVYKKGWDRYYLYKNSYEIALSMIDAYNFMGKQEQAYKERVRYIKRYNLNSEYYQKYKEFPPNFGDEIIMTAFYYNSKFDKEKKQDDYDLATQLYESLLEYFPQHKRAGEISFMLAQLYDEKGDDKRAVRFFKEARRLKFNEEESHYRSLFCEYKMWKRHEILSKELISSLEDFLINFKGSKYFNNSALVLADISYKEGLMDKMFYALELAGSNDEGLKMALDFAEANFDGIDNKFLLSRIFGKGYERYKDDRYLKLKHFSLFKYAGYLEGEGKKDYAATIYKEIINDKVSDFTEFAMYNLSLLLERDGKTEEAIAYMAKIKQKDDLKLKAKEFIYNFGKKKGMYLESAQAILDYAVLSKDKEIFYLIESSYLFLKGKAFDDAERVLYQLSRKKLTEREKKEKEFLEGLLNYYNNNYEKAYDLLISGLKSDVVDRFDNDVEEPIHNILSKTVFTKPEDEAREALELYVDYLAKKFRTTGDDTYLYKLGYILNEFSLFFLQQEEAKTRAIALLKRALKNSVEKNNRELILKSLDKLKEIDYKRYGRSLKLEPPDIGLKNLLNYESLIK